MTNPQQDTPHQTDPWLDDLLRRALGTPPISNEEIVQRSKAQKGKRGE